MTQDELESAYLAAYREYGAAKKAVSEMAKTLRAFSRELEMRPESTCFVNVEGEDEPPLDEMMVWHHKSWDAQTYPTVPQIQAAIRRMVVAKENATSLWDKLDDEHRSGLSRIF